MALEPYYKSDGVELHLGHCLDVLAKMPDASIDACVTDPPYEIGIAGQEWDQTGVAFNSAIWAQVLRVVKPGGHLLSFSAPRTYHRMACAAEEAGFRVIDQIDWIYTHGKPKGADLARAIDRHRDDREAVLAVTAWLANARDQAGWTNRQIDDLFGFSGMGGLWTTQGKAAIVPTVEQWRRMRTAIGFGTDMDAEVERLNARKRKPGEAWSRREVIGRRPGNGRRGGRVYGEFSGDNCITAPHSDLAKLWEGWNTALKPAHDPILLARKSTGYDSLVGGLLRHGVGGLNVAACQSSGGGWPANILLGHDCPEGHCLPGCPVRSMGDASDAFPSFRLNSKTPAHERVEVDGVEHVTPKPLDLMRWLVRLVTPPGGVVLDPFAGSGTTGEACVIEGFRSVLIELDPKHAELIKARLSKPLQPALDLFSEVSDGS